MKHHLHKYSALIVLVPLFVLVLMNLMMYGQQSGTLQEVYGKRADEIV